MEKRGSWEAGFNLPFLETPLDEEDPFFTKSFLLEGEESELLSFFDEYGFVVVRDVLSAQECEDTVADIWNIVENNSSMKRDDPTTWDDWPKNSLESHGVPCKLPVFTRVSLRNRQNQNVHKIFSLLFGSTQENPKRMWVNHDRYCLFRPSQPSSQQGGKYYGGDSRWQTQPTLHLDMDPWTFLSPDGAKHVGNTLNSLDYSLEKGNLHHFLLENNEFHPMIHGEVLFQGSITLLDNYEEDGGFICVPGFHRHFEAWTKSQDAKPIAAECKERKLAIFPSHDKIWQQAVRVTSRTGSLIVWDQRLPHGAVPNQSSNFRCAQFIKYFNPGTGLPSSSSRSRDRAITLRSLIETSGFLPELTPIGVSVFGLEEEKSNGRKDNQTKRKVGRS